MKEQAPSAIYAYNVERGSQRRNGDTPQSKRKWQLTTHNEGDSVDIYFEQVGEYPLLSVEEEKATAQAMEMGTAAHLLRQALLIKLIPNSNIQNEKRIDTFLSLGNAQEFIGLLNLNGSVKPITAESSGENESAEENPLARKVTGFEINDDIFELVTDFASLEKFLRLQIEMGKKARDLMINSNLRLVVSIAKRYGGKGLPLLDLIQEGNIGLMKAVDRFDVSKNCTLPTYATWWIRQDISRSIDNQAATIGISAEINEKLRRLAAAEGELYIKLGKKPAVSEIAEYLSIPEEKVQELLRIRHMKYTASIDEEFPQGERNNHPASLIQLIPNGSDTEEDAIERVSEEQVQELLGSCLTEREKSVLCLRYGIGQERNMTLEEIGQEIGITRERVRQIEAEALIKLRSSDGGLRNWLLDSHT